MCALQNGDHIKLNAALGKRLKTAVSDFGHLAGLPFLLILPQPPVNSNPVLKANKGGWSDL